MLILASKSPRRRELLGLIRPEFSVADPKADETLPDGISPHDAALTLSQIKACAAAAMPQHTADDIIIGSDTLVALDDLILGKPRDESDAKRMGQIPASLTAAVSGISDRVRIIPMSDDDSGTLVIEMPDEIIDASASTQMGNIRGLLSNSSKQTETDLNSFGSFGNFGF